MHLCNSFWQNKGSLYENHDIALLELFCIRNIHFDFGNLRSASVGIYMLIEFMSSSQNGQSVTSKFYKVKMMRVDVFSSANFNGILSMSPNCLQFGHFGIDVAANVRQTALMNFYFFLAFYLLTFCLPFCLCFPSYQLCILSVAPSILSIEC